MRECECRLPFTEVDRVPATEPLLPWPADPDICAALICGGCETVAGWVA